MFHHQYLDDRAFLGFVLDNFLKNNSNEINLCPQKPHILNFFKIVEAISVILDYLVIYKYLYISSSFTITQIRPSQEPTNHHQS